jgi:glycosyltransferase involved in cell wall biosynthesis
MTSEPKLTVVHLTGSPFVGGPESQMLGLARSLPPGYRTVFLCFGDGGRSRALLEEVTRHGFAARTLRHDAPHFRAVVSEIAAELSRQHADVLCCHGYKADICGALAARRVGVPVLAVAHGWTSASIKVRINEWLDKLFLRRMDRVVCVSQAQANRVRKTGVPPYRIVTIRNAVWMNGDADPDPEYRARLQALWPHPRAEIVGAAGRLSPEKGFSVLVDAASRIAQQRPSAGFVLFGDGNLRDSLQQQVIRCGLQERFVMAGFRTDLQQYWPHMDVAVLPSFTEGLPCVVLEAFAAGVPVVATRVGGTPELLEDGVHGYLVPPGDPVELAARVKDLLEDAPRRRAMGSAARRLVTSHFNFDVLSAQYQQLFAELVRAKK